MTGPPAVLVTKSSATHCRPWETGAEFICPILRNHSEVVKFNSQDSEYDKVIERLNKLAERALAPQPSKQTPSNKKCMEYTSLFQAPLYVLSSPSHRALQPESGFCWSPKHSRQA